MSAPVKERVATRSGVARPGTAPADIPAQRSRPRRAATGGERQERTGAAAERAYARRDDRLGRRVGRRLGKAATAPGRTPFALLVMGLLTTGLIATLWLSTAAAADSYRLSNARAAATALRQETERLHRDVANAEAAPAIIAAAQAQGMVAVQDPPRLVVAPDGSSEVVGTPHAVTRPAPIVAPVVDPAVPQVPPAEAETQVGDTAGGTAGTQPTDQQGAATTGTGASTTGAATTGAATTGAAATGAATTGTATTGTTSTGTATTSTTTPSTSASAPTAQATGTG